MSRRRLFVALAVAMLCIVGAFVVRPHPPRYSGKTLAEWFEEPDVKNRGLGSSTTGLAAFLELRGEAVPFLTRAATKGPNWGSRRYAILYLGSPSSLQQMLPPARSDADYRDRQARALWLLGTMVNWERQPGRTWSTSSPPLPVAKIRSCLRECLRDPSWVVRMHAAEAAGGLGYDAELLLPELAALLDETNENVRVAAIRALGQIGPPASNAVARLSDFLPRAKDHELRLIMETLDHIRPAAKPAAPQVDSEPHQSLGIERADPF